MAHDLNEKLTVTRFSAVKESKGDIRKLSWSKFSRDLTKCRPCDSKDGVALWSPATFDSDTRKKLNVKELSCLVFDVEKQKQKEEGPPPAKQIAARIEKLGWRAIVHTSFSHSPAGVAPADDSKGIGERYRVIFSLSRPIKPEELERLAQEVSRILTLSHALDPVYKNPAAIYYLPSCSPSRQPYFYAQSIHGIPINVDSLLSQISEQKQTPSQRGTGAFSDKEMILRFARGHWKEILHFKLGIELESLENKHKPCPGCGGKDRFRFDDINGNGSWICSQGNGELISGNGLELIIHTGLTEPEAIRLVTDYLEENGIVGPTSLRLIQQALLRQELDPGAIFEGEIIDLLRQLRSENHAEYARVRGRAKKLKASVTELDRLTALTPKDEEPNQDEFELFPNDDVWPGSVSGDQLLDEMVDLISTHVVADKETVRAVALWCCFTWFIDEVDFAPLANITAPEKRCGKSVLLELMQYLSYRPLPVSNISSAAIYRCIEKWGPTLLIDEVDTFLRASEEMRGIINAGVSRGNAFVIRCVGDNNEPTRFNVWGAKVLCGIGKLPSTLRDRSIPLVLRRKRAGEKALKVRRIDKDRVSEIRSKLAKFKEANLGKSSLYIPHEIEGLNDRANDCWEPLLFVAELAGGDWPKKASEAAIYLHGLDEGSDSPSTNVELLADIRKVFIERKVQRIFSNDLLNELNNNFDFRWGSHNRGKPLTNQQLGQRLDGFGIRSKQIRIGSETGRKGFLVEQFEDSWKRYLPN